MTAYDRLTDADRAALSAMYQEENERRFQLERDANKNNRAQAEAIAAELGASVTYDPSQDEPTTYYTIHLTDPETAGARIHLSYDRSVTDSRRLEISGGWPADPEDERNPQVPDQYRRRLLPTQCGALPWGEREPRISVAASRTPKAIAGEIRRRLLPTYLDLYAKTTEAARRRAQRIADQNAARERLRAIQPGAYASQYKPHDIHGDPSKARTWTAEIGGSSVYSLTLKELSVDDAERLIRLYLETTKPEQFR
jgi:hypothetical protein